MVNHLLFSISHKFYSSSWPTFLQLWKELQNFSTHSAEENACLMRKQFAYVTISCFILLHRFMRKHIEDLYMYVYNNSSKPAAKVTEWRSIVERVEKQLVLRIVSCCQIASKLNSHYEVNSILSFCLKFPFSVMDRCIFTIAKLQVTKTNFNYLCTSSTIAIPSACYLSSLLLM